MENSFQLVDKLNGIYFQADYQLASLDVVLVFTNVSAELITESIERRWENISKNIKIPKKKFLIAIKLILESTYFLIRNRQVFDSPMGSPLSPIIANVVVEDLKEKAFQLLSYRLLFYFRYVDDILLAAPPDNLNTVLEFLIP